MAAPRLVNGNAKGRAATGGVDAQRRAEWEEVEAQGWAWSIKSRSRAGHGRTTSRHKLGQSTSLDGQCRAMLILKPMNILASAFP